MLLIIIIIAHIIDKTVQFNYFRDTTLFYFNYMRIARSALTKVLALFPLKDFQ